VIVIHLTTIVFLYQKHHLQDDRITRRNMLVNIRVLWIKLHHKIKVHLWVVYIFYLKKSLYWLRNFPSFMES